MATPERIANVGRIVLAEAGGGLAIVVVSAFQGATNDLLECARLAETRDPACPRALEAIVARHRAAVDALFPLAEAPAVHARLEPLLGELNDAIRGIGLLRSCPRSALDLVASFGERLSGLIVADHLNRVRPTCFVDARQFIVTDDQFTRATVQMASSARAIRRYFGELWSAPRRRLPVVTGFIGRTKDGRTTTVGRNGSDYTAAIVGAALHASVIEIWTDVDGVLSADPRTVRSAFVLPAITYEQAHDLSYFGAKVLHPSAVAPAVAEGIPIRIKNTFNPQAPGTLIRRGSADDLPPATGVTSMADVTLLTLRGTRRAASRMSERLFRALSDQGIDVLLTSQASSDQAICVAISSTDAPAVIKAIAREFRFERRQRRIVIERQANQSLLAVVANGRAQRHRAASMLLDVLGAHGIEVSALAEGGANRTIVCAVDATHRTRALNLIHQRLAGQPTSLALAVAGVGTVGGALLSQIAGCQAELSHRGIDLRVVAVANSRRFVVAPEGIDLAGWRAALDASTEGMDARAFAAALGGLDLPAGAMVDCTASDALAEEYGAFADAGLHVISANKRPGVLPADRYAAMTARFAANRRQWLSEATVGAGLPVISTIRDLVESGDRIVKVEGLFSGTLSYLFHAFDGRTPFSALIRTAHERGLTEPDPREDLGGLDVARKLVILARHAGFPVDLDDVRVDALLPSGLTEGPFSDRFFSRLTDVDAAMAARCAAAESRGCVLRYVGSVDEQGARAGLRELPRDHALAATKGTDNSIAFTTRRYRDTPLVIQGPGAGAEVTAMGVFSDILRLLRSHEK